MAERRLTALQAIELFHNLDVSDENTDSDDSSSVSIIYSKYIDSLLYYKSL